MERTGVLAREAGVDTTHPIVEDRELRAITEHLEQAKASIRAAVGPLCPQGPTAAWNTRQEVDLRVFFALVQSNDPRKRLSSD